MPTTIIWQAHITWDGVTYAPDDVATVDDRDVERLVRSHYARVGTVPLPPITHPDPLPQYLLPAEVQPLVDAAVIDALTDDELVAAAAVEALNDALEAGAGTEPTVSTRTNMATNPRGLNAGGWTTVAKYGARVTDPTKGRFPGGMQRWTRPVLTLDNGLVSAAWVAQFTGSIATGGFGVTAGKTYAVVMDAVASVVARSRVAITWYDAANVAVGAALTGAFLDTPAYVDEGSIRRPFVIGVAPVGAVKLSLTAGTFLPVGQVAVGGEDSWMGNVLVEEVPPGTVVPPEYFDGAVVDTATVVNSWTGAADGSASTESTTIPGIPGLEVEPPQGGAGVLDSVLREWATAKAWQLTGEIVRDPDTGTVMSANIVWVKDASTGTLTQTLHPTFAAVNTRTLTHALSGRKVTFAAPTRDGDGNPTSKPVPTVEAI